MLKKILILFDIIRQMVIKILNLNLKKIAQYNILIVLLILIKINKKKFFVKKTI